MRRLSCLLFGLAVLGSTPWSAFGQAKKEAPRDPPKMVVPGGPCFKHLDGQMLVFVANGAGGSTAVSDNLIELNGEKHLGLRIQMVPWCRQNSVFKNLTDHEAQLTAAARIACSVTAIRRDAPNAHIFFVGQSAGARVVLAAAEMLPPQSIDRLIVLSPAVSCTYDLTIALKTAHYGIDNFWSSEDSLLDSQHYRNADGQPGHAAGRVGFRPASSETKDLEAHRRLRQYRWNENLAGNGGHLAWTLPHNMKKVLVPLFFTAPAGD
jgi:pimeloyl-ACP methyl ester carboxylesterase